MERADAAAQLTRNLGFPSKAVVNRMIRGGAIARNPITAKDVDNAEDIYGKPVPFLRGKSVKRKPLVARAPELSKRMRVPLTLHTDIFFVAKKPYLLSVVMPLGFSIVTWMQGKRTAANIKRCMDQHMRVIRSRNFSVDTIFVDSEKGLEKLKGVYDGVHVDVCGADQHVPVAEARIKVIKNTVRAVLASLPWRLPRSKLPHAVFYANTRINSVPSMASVDVETPRERFWGTKLDYLKDLKLGFGDYCEIYCPAVADNTLAERTTSAIALYPTGNLQGSWRFLDLKTMKVVARDQYTVLPTPSVVIDRMNAAAAGENGDANFEDDFMDDDDTVEHQSHQGGTVTPDDMAHQEHEGEGDVPAESEEVAQEPSERIGLHLTVKKALRTRGQAALNSIIAELTQMVDKKVWTYVNYDTLSYAEKKKIITCSMFLKEKFNSEGTFEKLKARLVAHGNQQRMSPGEKTSSPTVDILSVMLVVAVAAHEGRRVTVIDIGGAYLEAEMTGEVIYMRLDRLNAELLRQIDPTSVPFETDNGDLIVKLDRALYGCVQASRIWYDKLSSVLEACGYQKSGVDQCTFVKGSISDGQCVICVHVDDLLIADSSNFLTEELVTFLKSQFAEIKVHEGKKHSYLGMTLDFGSKGTAKVSMCHYVDSILAEYDVRGSVNTPADDNLFTIDEKAEKLDNLARERFHTAVAKLLFLAKRARPDILVAVAFLTTRVTVADSHDLKKLGRVLKYINGTRDLALLITPEALDEVRVYVDASYGSHVDAKSHTGRALTLGQGVLTASSSKQMIVTKSSTEAEMVGLSDSIGDSVSAAQFMSAHTKSMGQIYCPSLSRGNCLSTYEIA